MNTSLTSVPGLTAGQYGFSVTSVVINVATNGRIIGITTATITSSGGGGLAAPTIIQHASSPSAYSTSFTNATTPGSTILVIGSAPNCPSATFFQL